MSEQQTLVPAEPQKVHKADIQWGAEPTLLQVIEKLALKPEFDVEKLDRVIAVQERLEKERRRVAFYAALSRIQAGMPQITRHGVIASKGSVRNRYAKIEDIDRVIRPMMREEGFALSFDSEKVDDKHYRLTCTLSHQEGHSETNSLVLPIDASQFRTATQNVGSSTSYGKRQLTKMHFNIIETEEDDDGSGQTVEAISREQALDIEALIEEVGVDRSKFLNWLGQRFGIDSIYKITVSQQDSVIKKLEATRRGK